jgi:hypothetical protein
MSIESAGLSDASLPRSATRLRQWRKIPRVLPNDFQVECRIGHCKRTPCSWDDYGMQKNIEMGPAGSITVAVLIIAVVFLMRSFYKRFMGVDRSDDATDN